MSDDLAGRPARWAWPAALAGSSARTGLCLRRDGNADAAGAGRRYRAAVGRAGARGEYLARGGEWAAAARAEAQ